MTDRRAIHELQIAEAVELLGIGKLLKNDRDIAETFKSLIKTLQSVDRKLGHIMTALEDLRAVDAELAAAVTDLSSAVDRIDADFAKLEDAVANDDTAAIEAEVVNLRTTLDAAKAAKASIDATDPQAAPADGTPAEPGA